MTDTAATPRQVAEYLLKKANSEIERNLDHTIDSNRATYIAIAMADAIIAFKDCSPKFLIEVFNELNTMWV